MTDPCASFCCAARPPKTLPPLLRGGQGGWTWREQQLVRWALFIPLGARLVIGRALFTRSTSRTLCLVVPGPPPLAPP